MPGDNNSFNDVFVRELATGVVRRVSITAAGVQPNGQCFEPLLSDDGTLVAFSSWANNLAASDNNGAGTDIFVKDLVSGALEHVSVNASGVGGDGISAYHDFSGNGRFVTFYSYSSNLVPGDTNGGQDTFLFDRVTGVIECLSRDPVSGAPAGGGQASVSDDGRFVAFETWAPLFGTNSTTIALLDRQTGTVAPVAFAAPGQTRNASHPILSGDGGTVLFDTLFALDPADVDFVSDCYAYDVASGTLQVVSVEPSATPSRLACHSNAISDDGRFVVWSSASAFLGSDVNALTDAYLLDRASGQLELLTLGDLGQLGNEGSSVRSISDDGRRAVFLSRADNLIAVDGNMALDVFVRDRCIAASWSSYGMGLPGTGGVVPGLAFVGDPVIGTAPLLAIANPSGVTTIGVLLLGSEPSAIPTPLFGTLLVRPMASATLSIPSPALLLPLAIPNDLDLCGTRLYFQALLIDSGAPAGVAFTRGLDAVIGG